MNGIDENKAARNRKIIIESSLIPHVSPSVWPIFYHPKYNISFYGIEKLHVFDTKKWRKVVERLIEKGMITMETIVMSKEAKHSDLLVVHSEEYLKSINESSNAIGKCVDMPPLAIFPHCLLENALLKPMRYQVGGTVGAAFLALDKNWAINIGGGYHHACSNVGQGFCIYADITLALTFLFDSNRIKSALIVDCDAHQGNGHERDFKTDNRVYILDVFNHEIYPHDFEAKDRIDRDVRLKCGTEDDEYLKKLSKELSATLGEFNADIIFYNAGTDILIGDPLGLMNITPQGVIDRDELVFKLAFKAKTPIVMVTSGGYTKASGTVIADSILNLHTKGYLKKCTL
uniref:Histone deacetylase 11 n=1 Tax=Parastrongyloides trichosuri TaxID=131310 RepID=A0A0N4Z4Q0_PARTI